MLCIVYRQKRFFLKKTNLCVSVSTSSIYSEACCASGFFPFRKLTAAGTTNAISLAIANNRGSPPFTPSSHNSTSFSCRPLTRARHFVAWAIQRVSGLGMALKSIRSSTVGNLWVDKRRQSRSHTQTVPECALTNPPSLLPLADKVQSIPKHHRRRI